MNTKKLAKSKSDKKICGVCSGLAKYFGIDVTIIRTIFVIVLLAGGSSLPVYLILALVMPDESEIQQPIDVPYEEVKPEDGDNR